MNREYIVYDGQLPVGEVKIEKDKLYYRVCCKCRLPKDKIYRLIVCSGNSHYNLGVCVPKGDNFEVKTKIPVSRLSESELRFYTEVNCNSYEKVTCQVLENEPFEQIDMLRRSFFAKEGEKSIIVQQRAKEENIRNQR